MENPCTPECIGRNIYCHSYCNNYKLWKREREKYKKRNKIESEYIGYVKDAVMRMKGGRK